MTDILTESRASSLIDDNALAEAEKMLEALEWTHLTPLRRREFVGCYENHRTQLMLDSELQNKICGIVSQYGCRDIYDATNEILSAFNPYVETDSGVLGEISVVESLALEIAIAKVLNPYIYIGGDLQDAVNGIIEAIRPYLKREIGDRRLIEALNDSASQPCTTIGNEDMEAGCCCSCRARALLKEIEGQKP